MKDKYRVIYKPKGKAGEYAELAVNPYTGCDHACLYCYCPTMLRQTREDFHKNIQPKKDYLARLERDIAEMIAAGDRRQVMLAFTTDPYNKLEEEWRLTQDSLRLFRDNDIPFNVLTKSALYLIAQDFNFYTNPKSQFGITLTTLNEAMALEWEPNAAKPRDRAYLLYAAKRYYDIKTWVSLEPVIDPDEAIKVIKYINGYADMIKIGKLNYHPKAKDIDWRRFAFDAVEQCEKLGQKYMIKADLKKFME